MAYYRKRGTRWRAEVERKGQKPESATFDIKAEAVAWATRVEADILAGRRGGVRDKTVGEMLDEYRDKVSVHKRGYRWETARIGLLKRDTLAQARLPALDSPDIAAWRDRRLRAVSAASLRREWNLLHHAFAVAINEWRWLRENPMKGVARPAAPEARCRLITDRERERLLWAMGDDLTTITGRVGAAFRLAIATGMRAGELCALTWQHVHLDRNVAHIPKSKNGTRRDVPLSVQAVEVIEELRTARDMSRDVPLSDLVLRLKTSQIDAIFRKCRDRALIEDLHFHDTRHQAITELAGQMDVLDLARSVGIRNLKILLVYYNRSADDVARALRPLPPVDRGQVGVGLHLASEPRGDAEDGADHAKEGGHRTDHGGDVGQRLRVPVEQDHTPVCDGNHEAGGHHVDGHGEADRRSP